MPRSIAVCLAACVVIASCAGSTPTPTPAPTLVPATSSLEPSEPVVPGDVDPWAAATTAGHLRLALDGPGIAIEAPASCTWARFGGRDAVGSVATERSTVVAGWEVGMRLEAVPWVADPWLSPPVSLTIAFDKPGSSFSYEALDPSVLAYRVSAGDRAAGSVRVRTLAVGGGVEPGEVSAPMEPGSRASVDWVCQRPGARLPDAADMWDVSAVPVVSEATARLVTDPPVEGLPDELPAWCWRATEERSAEPVLDRVDVSIELVTESTHLVVAPGGAVLWRTAPDGTTLGEYVGDQGTYRNPIGDGPITLSLGDLVYRPITDAELPLGGEGGWRGFVGRLIVTCGDGIVLGSPTPSEP